MSAPMGVPIQRTRHVSSTKQGPGPIATSRSDSKPKLSASLKKPYEKPLALRTHSLNKEMPPRSGSTSSSGSPSGSKREKQEGLAGDISKKSSRKIASNSRIRKEEQNKREMYLLFVNNAFKTKSEGNTSSYEELISQFSSSSSYNYAQLNNWLLALSHVVSQLDKRYVALVESIIHMPWTTSPDETFVKSYINFVGMLVSARTEWVNMVVASAIKRLTHHSALNTPPPNAASTSQATPVTLRIVFERTHLLIQTLLSLFPTLPSSLPTHLLRCFPHKSHSVSSHTVYCRNLVELMGYCPQLVEPALSLITERAVAIDVEIQVELEELEEMVDEEVDGDGSSQARGKSGLLVDFDPFNTLAGQESDSDSDAEDEEGLQIEDIENFSDVSSEAERDEDEDEQKGELIDPREAERKTKKVREMVAKLDGIMGILLKWLQRTWDVSMLNSPANGQKAEQPPPLQHPHFSTLISIFDKTILTTFKSRYTQFLIFYLVSLPSKSKLKEVLEADDHSQSISTSILPPNPHTDMFLGVLLHNTLIPQAPAIPMLTRIASASYLSSFVSRALCVGRMECRHVMVVCCQWISVHLSELETLLLAKSNPSNSTQDDEGLAHTELAVFYSVAQAIFLVFCFRWRELLEEEAEEEDPDEGEGVRSRSRRWLPEMSIIQRLIVSPLNPLKVCSPNVVIQFSKVSQKVNFVYCDSIIESNRRSANLSISPLSLTSGLLTPVDKEVNTPTTPNGIKLNQWSAATVTAAMSDLHSFFPFDPYRLPQSSRWFEGIYREWGMVALDDEEDEDEEDDEGDSDSGDQATDDQDSDNEGAKEQRAKDDEEGTDEEGYGVPMELGSVRDNRRMRGNLDVEESFGKMSISPVQAGVHHHMNGRTTD